jgi:hypothetical protein
MYLADALLGSASSPQQLDPELASCMMSDCRTARGSPEYIRQRKNTRSPGMCSVHDGAAAHTVSASYPSASRSQPREAIDCGSSASLPIFFGALFGSADVPQLA